MKTRKPSQKHKFTKRDKARIKAIMRKHPEMSKGDAVTWFVRLGY